MNTADARRAHALRQRTGPVWLHAATAVCVLAGAAMTVHAQATKSPRPDAATTRPSLIAELDAALDSVWTRLGDASAKSGGGDTSLAKLAEEADRIFAQAVAYGPIPTRGKDAGAALLTRSAATRRLTRQLVIAQDSAPRLRALLAASPNLAMTLALSVRSGSGADGAAGDDVAGVYRVLGALETADPGRLSDAALGTGGVKLAAAVCVVFDQARRHPTDQTAGPGAPAPAVFDHFRDAHAKLVFKPDALPVELLTWMVGVNVSRDEMTWALKQHAGNRTVGRLFDTITYDTDNFKRGAVKKIEKAGGYTLQNIKRVGGVCEEQAYFASEVGRSIGVPTALVSAQGADSGHAWVGYLSNSGRWDFSEGRGDGQYEDLVARAVHPQTLEGVSEGVISLTAGLAETDEADRRLGVALLDAAEVLLEASASASALGGRAGGGSGDDAGGRAARAWPPPALAGVGGDSGVSPRAAGAGSALAMLEAAGRASPFDERVWLRASALGAGGAMSAKERASWGEAALKACGVAAPDFAMQILAGLFRGEPDPEAQSRLWDWAARKFQSRPDLASAARLAQGDLWAEAGNPGKAWEAYNGVIERFANEGALVMRALTRSEQLLRAERKNGAVLGLYESAFRRVSRPSSQGAAYWRSSNYYQIGKRYADLLRAAGRTSDAERIERQVEPKDDPSSGGNVTPPPQQRRR